MYFNCELFLLKFLKCDIIVISCFVMCEFCDSHKNNMNFCTYEKPSPSSYTALCGFKVCFLSTNEKMSIKKKLKCVFYALY